MKLIKKMIEVQRLALLMIIIFVFVPLAHSSTGLKECKPGYVRTSANIPRLNNHVDHGHCYMDIDEHTDVEVEKYRSELGVGADVPLWINERFDIDGEYRHDFNNDNNNFYGVIKPKMEKGIIQHALNFLFWPIVKLFGM